MLESLGTTNIGHINLDEPIKLLSDLPFDSDRDISPADWTNILDNTKRIFHPEKVEYVMQAVNLKLLDPDRFKEIAPYIETELFVWNHIEHGIRIYHQEIENLLNGRRLDYNRIPALAFNYTLNMFNAKVLFPNHIRLYEYNEPVFDRLLLLEGNGFAGAQNTLSSAFRLKVIYPEKELPELTPRFCLSEEVYIEGLSEDPLLSTFAVEAARFKVVSPDDFQGLGVLNELTWKKLHKALEQQRRIGLSTGTWDGFIQHALNMKILAAEEINITDQGVDLVMPEKFKSFNQSTPALPETRKF